MAKSANALHLGNISIRQLDGLFSLNDLHQASGGESRYQPAKFMRLEQTKDLIEEISKSPDLAIPNAGISAFESRRGFNGGTYACRELVIAYAAWINPAFHLKVLRVFLDAAKPAAAAPVKKATPLLGEKSCKSMMLNPSEQELINMLRWTTYAGRDAVREAARLMRMRHPWNDADMATNTARAKGVRVQVTFGT